MSLQKERELEDRMRRLNIREEDIEESFVRSSGPGGQNVNKVATCVYLRHLPTGIKVRFQKSRQQALNRYQARCLLIDKIQDHIVAAALKLRQESEKKKRQRRKRPAHLKEEILKEKRFKSRKKSSREKIQYLTD